VHKALVREFHVIFFKEYAMKTLRYAYVILALLCPLMSSSIGCKRQTTPSSAALVDNPLLLRLPDKTLGFYTWRTDTEPYRKFSASRWHQDPVHFITKFSNTVGQQLPTVREKKPIAEASLSAITEVIAESGLFGEKGKPAVAAGTFFVAEGDNLEMPVSVSLYLHSAVGTDMTKSLSKIASVLKKHGYECSPLESFKAESCVTRIGATDGVELTLLADEAHLAISSSKKIAQALFAEDTVFISTLKTSSHFNKAVTKIKDQPNQLAFLYVDLEKLISLKPLAEAFKSVSDSTFSKIKPVSLAGVETMDVTPAYEYALAWEPSPAGRELPANIEPSGSLGVLQKLPADMVLTVMLDGNLISSLKKSGLENIPVKEAGMAAKQLELLDEMKGLTLGIRGAPAGTLFPELLLLLQPKNVKEFEQSTKEVLSSLLSLSGMPSIQWQDKELAGNKTSYWFSPIGGVGIYLSRKDEVVALASWESILSAYLSATPAGKGTLGGELQFINEELSADSPLACIYVNFIKLGSLIETASGTLAMFTGGKPAIDLKEIQDLKKLGKVLLALRYHDYVARITARFE